MVRPAVHRRFLPCRAQYARQSNLQLSFPFQNRERLSRHLPGECQVLNDRSRRKALPRQLCQGLSFILIFLYLEHAL